MSLQKVRQIAYLEMFPFCVPFSTDITFQVEFLAPTGNGWGHFDIVNYTAERLDARPACVPSLRAEINVKGGDSPESGGEKFRPLGGPLRGSCHLVGNHFRLHAFKFFPSLSPNLFPTLLAKEHPDQHK